MNIRRAEYKDLVKLQVCNTHNLPENYPMRFWTHPDMYNPEMSFLVEDENGKVVGYVLSSVVEVDYADNLWIGSINTLSVLRPYRRMGLAEKLMNLSRDAMLRSSKRVEYIHLNTRVSNRAAISLYRDKLGYQVQQTVVKYYGDEDALSMKLPIYPREGPQLPPGFKEKSEKKSEEEKAHERKWYRVWEREWYRRMWETANRSVIIARFQRTLSLP